MRGLNLRFRTFCFLRVIFETGEESIGEVVFFPDLGDDELRSVINEKRSALQSLYGKPIERTEQSHLLYEKSGLLGPFAMGIDIFDGIDAYLTRALLIR